MMHGIFISEPCNGLYYTAERATRVRGAQKFHWSSMPAHLNAADTRIDPSAVPYRIRRQACRWLALGICAAVLLAQPADAGDYAIFECPGIKAKVVMGMPEKGDVGFQEWIRDPKDGVFRGGKELPRNLFRVEDHGDRVYYRGKRCVELEQ
jgi:hypothetical protein